MKRVFVIVCSICVLMSVSSGAIAQEIYVPYLILGRIEGSPCPGCEGSLSEPVMGIMVLKKVLGACPYCWLYEVSFFRAQGETFQVELGDMGGKVYVFYEDGTASLMVDLAVNGHDVFLSRTGFTRLAKKGPLLFFTYLPASWCTLAFIALPFSG